VETYARICGDVELDITETFGQAPGVGRDAFIGGILPGGKTVADAAGIVSLLDAGKGCTSVDLHFNLQRIVWDLHDLAAGCYNYLLDLNSEGPGNVSNEQI